MATICEDARYAELLMHVEFEGWPLFVRGATHVISQFTGEDKSALCDGMVLARQMGVDFREAKWTFLLWEMGAYADFIERLQRATSPTTAAAQPGSAADGSDAGGDR